MANIKGAQEKEIKRALLNAIMHDPQFDKEFVNYFVSKQNSIALTRQKRYVAIFKGKVEGEARCSYEEMVSDERCTFTTEINLFNIPFTSYVSSRSPLSEKDLPSSAGEWELEGETRRRMNAKYGRYKILSVRRTDVRVLSSDFSESYEYGVEFRYRNKTVWITFDGKNAYTINTNYKSPQTKMRNVSSVLLSHLVPILLGIAGFALYFFAAVDFCSGGNIVKVICTIAYGAILFFPFIFLLVLIRSNLKYAIKDNDKMSYLLFALSVLGVLALYALTIYLGFFLKI